ncbi:MAG: MSMEG_1061 family FMN-dependent PPOX-type flavoprotein, partial [Pseudomonadota bacterium]
MKTVQTIKQLEALYPDVVPLAIKKVAHIITPQYKRWIVSSRFVALGTVGTNGLDVSPRGDSESVVSVFDDTTLLLPDWRGNNRLDSLRNILSDNRVSMMFMIPGCKNVVRVSGTAILSVDPKLICQFERRGQHPTTVVVVSVSKLFFQCAKSIMRSDLWSGVDHSAAVPTAGDFLKEADQYFDSKAFD